MTTGVIVEDDEEVVATGRCGARVVATRVGLRGDGVVTAACVEGVGLTVGGLILVVVVVAAGDMVVLAAVAVFCVPVCWPLLLPAPLRPARLLRGVVVGVVGGGAISADGLALAISVVGLPVICRGRRVVGGLLAAVLVEVVFVFGTVAGGVVVLLLLTGCERTGEGVGEAVAATVLGLGSVVRAGVSRRALINSLS